MFKAIRSSVEELGFKASDIMHPWSNVVTVPRCADPLSQVRERGILFDYIPIVDSEGICGIVDRKSGKCVYDVQQLISPETHLLDILEELCCRQINQKSTMLFIGDQDRPEGIINHADLNKRPVSVLLYIVLSDFEIKLSKLIVNYGAENWWLDNLSEEDKEQLNRKYEDELRQGLELDMMHCAMLKHKLKALTDTEDLWKKLGYKSHSQVKKLCSLNRWRDRVSHKSNRKDLIYKKSDLGGLWSALIRLEQALEALNREGS